MGVLNTVKIKKTEFNKSFIEEKTSETSKNKVEKILGELSSVGDFSSLLKYNFSGDKIVFSYKGINIGVIEYSQKKDGFYKYIFLDFILTVNNRNFLDYRQGIDSFDYSGVEIPLNLNIEIDGLGVNMFLEALKYFKNKGFKKLVLTPDDGAEGFYEKIVERYNEIYFDFYKDDFGYYVFNLI